MLALPVVSLIWLGGGAPAQWSGAPRILAVASALGSECNQPHAALEPPHESAACDHRAAPWV